MGIQTAAELYGRSSEDITVFSFLRCYIPVGSLIAHTSHASFEHNRPALWGLARLMHVIKEA